MFTYILCPSTKFTDTDEYFIKYFNPKTTPKLIPFNDKLYFKNLVRAKSYDRVPFKKKNKVYGTPNKVAAEIESTALRQCSGKSPLVAMGDLAFYMLTGISPIGDYRGCWVRTLGGGHCLPTYELDEVYTTWPHHVTVLADFEKARKTLPIFEERLLCLRPTYKDLMDWHHKVAAAPMLSIDIETSDGQLDCLGIALSSKEAICIPFREAGQPYWSEALLPKVKAVVAGWLQGAPKLLAQNCTYEMIWLDAFGISLDPAKFEDTMFQHHALSPEQPKALEYLASLYCNERAWKTMVSFKKAEKIEND